MRLSRMSALAVCLLTAFSVFSVALDKPSTTAAPFEKYLPESTMMVFSITDLGELKALITDPKLQRIYELVGIGGRIAEFHRNYTEEFYNETGMKPSELLEALTGDVTLAILDSDFKGVPNIVLLAKVDPARFPYQKLIDLAIENEGAGDVVSHDVNGVTVTEVTGGASFALAGDHLFYASSMEAMRQALAPDKRLTGSPVYQRHREMTKLSGGLVGYIDVAMFLERLQPFLPDPDSNEGQEVELVLNLLGLRQVTSVSLSIPFVEGEPSRIFIHAPGYDGILTKLFSGAPVGIDSAGLVPADYDSFFAVSIQKPLDVLNSIFELLEEFNPQIKAEDFDSFAKSYEDTIGLSIKGDLLAPLGTTVGAGLKLNPDAEINLFAGPEEVFNFFRFELFFSLNDPDTFLSAMLKLAEASNGNLQVDTYKGATLFTARPPTLPSTIDFAIHGDHLLFCLGTDSIKEAIDAAESGNSLGATQEFQGRAARVPADSWYIAYNSNAYLKKFFPGFFKQFLTLKTDSEEQASDITAALLDYVGEDSGGIGFSTVTSDGLYFESSASMRAVMAIIPVYLSMAGIDQFE
jgi:hypothetical protein